MHCIEVVHDRNDDDDDDDDYDPIPPRRAPPLFSLGAVPPKPVSEPMDKGRAASFRGRETKQRCCAQVRRGNAKAMAKSQNRGVGGKEQRCRCHVSLRLGDWWCVRKPTDIL